MKQGQKRLTPEQIEGIKQLHKKGWSSNRIGEKFGINHTSVLYHIGRIKRKVNRQSPKKQERREKPSEIPEFIRKNLEAREVGKRKHKMVQGFCMVCGKKIEDKKWKLTNYCSTLCFGEKKFN